MNLEKLYKMQEELDNYIIKNRNITMNEAELLDKTILALLVEVGELANATRCFKHWSTKGPESKERLLDELADIWHFYLSIGNQIGIKLDKQLIYENSNVWETLDEGKTDNFITLYLMISFIADDIYGLYNRDEYYIKLGTFLMGVGEVLGFTDEEVEQAYMKKHEENYRRQREGY